MEEEKTNQEVEEVKVAESKDENIELLTLEEVEQCQEVSEESLEIQKLNLRSMIEAMLFVNSEPLTIKRIVEITERTKEEVDRLIKEMKDSYLEENSGLQLVEIKQGGEQAIQIRSKAELAVVLTKLKAGRPRRLSKPALETLSIIAYRQPIVKSDIDKIRGVDSAPTVKTLLDRKLISIIGHQASVGQPALYSTTDEFLSIFGLKNISDLPTLRELNEIESEPGELPLQ